jgi:hypothetical protein
MVFLAVRISSKEAPSLTPSSFSAFSKDISEGRESSAVESFAFAISRKDRCESLLLQDDLQRFSTWANLAKCCLVCPHLRLFAKGEVWTCIIFLDEGKQRQQLIHGRIHHVDQEH